MSEIFEFKGTPEKLVYENRGNDYRIYGVFTKDKRIKLNKYGTATVLGTVHELAVSVDYTFTAKEEPNKKNPSEMQYTICGSVKRDIPIDEYATKSFLSEILTYNQVQSIMNAYPDIVDRVMQNKLDDIDLEKTPHIKEFTFNKIKEKIEQNFVYSELIADFGGLLTIATVKKLYGAYHSATIIRDKMAHAPYRMLCNLSRVGFKTADSILMNMDREIKTKIKNGENPKFQFAVGNLRTSLDRAYSACEYVLEQNENSGSTKMVLDEFVVEIKTLVPESTQHIRQILSDRRFINVDKGTKSIGLTSLFDIESDIASMLLAGISKTNYDRTDEEIDTIVNQYELVDDIKLSEEQLNGVKNLIKHQVSAVVGVAGCVDNETEFFNGYGWKKISDYTEGDLVLQANYDRSAELVEPLEYHKYEELTMYHLTNESNTVNQVLSKEHNVAYVTSKGHINKKQLSEVIDIQNNNINGFRGKFLNSFEYVGGNGISLTDDEIRLMVAVMADGSFTITTDECRMNLKKDRKKERIEKLLIACGIEYRVRQWNPKDLGYLNFIFYAPLAIKTFPKNWYDATKEQLEIIADEAIKWDGRVDKIGRRSYFTTIKEDAEFMQFVYSSLGHTANIRLDDRVGEKQISSNGNIYIRKSISYEVTVSKRKFRLTSISNTRNKSLMHKITEYTEHDGYKYCFTVPSGLLVLRRDGKIFVTGNSGKTFSLKAILNYLDSQHANYLLLAPTGRASKQMNYYVNKPTSTIHRGLGYSGEWHYNEENKVPFNYVVVDECSMIDVRLMDALLSSIDFNRTKLVMIGDPYQLPSVGCGNVFHDIIQSRVVPVTMLTKVFRYGEGGVLTVATKIRNSENFIETNDEVTKFGVDSDFMFIPVQQEKIIAYASRIYKKILSNGVSQEDIMVLSSQNVGDYGTIALNKYLQKLANTNKGTKIPLGDATISVGDLVLQYVNNYGAPVHEVNSNGSVDIFDESKTAFISNGDIGKIKEVVEYRKGKYYIVIDFEGINVRYFDGELKANINLAYSISCHKSQGAGADYVIIIVPKAHTFMLNSNLLYVAVTRTKKKCYMIGSPKVVRQSIKKKANFERNTWLKSLLTMEVKV